MQFSKSYCIEKWNGSLFSVLHPFIRFCCAISSLVLFYMMSAWRKMVRAFAMMVVVVVYDNGDDGGGGKTLTERTWAIWWHDRSRACAHCWALCVVHTVYTFLLSENGGRQHVKLISCRDSNFLFWSLNYGFEMKNRFKPPYEMIIFVIVRGKMYGFICSGVFSFWLSIFHKQLHVWHVFQFILFIYYYFLFLSPEIFILIEQKKIHCVWCSINAKQFETKRNTPCQRWFNVEANILC